MKQIIFDGRIGKDAEVRTTRGGKPFVRFSVANNSFVGGQDKTEWFDVTSYDPYVIENRVKYLTKGTYVIISGSLNTETAVKDGKIWQNQYVTATTIDTPNFGKRDNAEATSQVNESSAPVVSTYTAATQTVMSAPFPTPTPTPSPAPQPAYAGVGYGYAGADATEDDDIPF